MSAPDDTLTAGDAAKLRHYERIDRLSHPPFAGLIALPLVGSLIGQALRLLLGWSLFQTSREDALSGVSNKRLLWGTILGLGAALFITGVFSLYATLAPELPPQRLWVAQAGVAVLIVLGLPYLIEGLGMWLGTIGHTFGGAKRSLHMRLNQFHRPTRNIFSPRR